MRGIWDRMRSSLSENLNNPTGPNTTPISNPRIMKTKSIRLMLATAALGVLASFAYAGPGPQYWQTLRNEAQFKQLKAGDKIAYVCNQCKTVSEVTIDTPAQAMEHCKEGAKVTCPACKEKVRIVTKGPPKNPSIERQVTYVNDKGEECMFIAKVAEKK